MSHLTDALLTAALYTLLAIFIAAAVVMFLGLAIGLSIAMWNVHPLFAIGVDGFLASVFCVTFIVKYWRR